MLVTFTNLTTGATAELLHINCLYKQLEAGESVQTHRTLNQLNDEQELKKLIVAGKIGVTMDVESGDLAGFGETQALRPYSDITRPSPNTVPLFSAIWNTSDNALNWSDGTNWRNGIGVIT